MIKLSTIINKSIWFLTLVLFISFYIFNDNEYSRFILFGITGMIGFFELIKYNKHFPLYFHQFHVTIMLFSLFIFFSAVWSMDSIISLTHAVTVLQLLICMSILYIHFFQQNNSLPLLDIVMWGGFIVVLYAFGFYGLDNIKYVFQNMGRLDNSFANVNNIGLLAGFSCIIAFYKILFYRFKMYHFLIVSNVILIAATGSRKALVLFVLGIYCIFFLRYSSKNWLLNILRYLFIFSLLVISIRLLLEIPIFDTVKHRMDLMFNLFTGSGKIDTSTLERQWYIHIGWEQFKQTPWLGIGIGASRELLKIATGNYTYMHNNYVELLACGGVVGFCVYYFMFGYILIRLFQQHHLQCKETDVCIILSVLLLIMDWGFVSYYSKNTYFYLMLFFLQIKFNERQIRKMKV